MEDKGAREAADTNGMRRRLPLVCAVVVALASAPASSAKRQASWAQPQIKAVVAAGVMGTDVSTFRPDDVLTRRALETLVAGLPHSPPATPATPSAPVTMAGLD